MLGAGPPCCFGHRHTSNGTPEVGPLPRRFIVGLVKQPQEHASQSVAFCRVSTHLDAVFVAQNRREPYALPVCVDWPHHVRRRVWEALQDDLQGETLMALGYDYVCGLLRVRGCQQRGQNDQVAHQRRTEGDAGQLSEQMH